MGQKSSRRVPLPLGEGRGEGLGSTTDHRPLTAEEGTEPAVTGGRSSVVGGQLRWGPLAVGHGAALAGWRIVAVAGVRSAPIERLLRQAAEEGRLLDLSFGRRVRSVVVLDSGHVAKLAITPETVLARWRGAEE